VPEPSKRCCVGQILDWCSGSQSSRNNKDSPGNSKNKQFIDKEEGYPESTEIRSSPCMSRLGS
jgi:hypothetical protein